MNSDDVNKEIQNWIWGARSTISTEAAQEIARWYQSPNVNDAPITVFAQRRRILDMGDFTDCILTNGRQHDFPNDLAALMNWARKVGSEYV